jgi:hypothetical protein
MIRAKKIGVLLILASLTLSAGSALAAKTASNPKPGTKITVIGTLTKGVECQALKEDKTDKLFTLTTRPAGYVDGDHVKVSGTVAGMTPCMQGTTITVSSIEKVK